MSAKIYQFTPKGSAWLVYYRRWVKGGCTTNWGMVFNYSEGLTSFEAWQAISLPGSPPFYEVITVQLDTFPSTGKSEQRAVNTSRKSISVNTKKKDCSMNGSGKPTYFTEPGYYKELWLEPVDVNRFVQGPFLVWCHEDDSGWHGWRSMARKTDPETTWLKGMWNPCDPPPADTAVVKHCRSCLRNVAVYWTMSREVRWDRLCERCLDYHYSDHDNATRKKYSIPNISKVSVNTKSNGRK
jgi:hypothetical protein